MVMTIISSGKVNGVRNVPKTLDNKRAGFDFLRKYYLKPPLCESSLHGRDRWGEPNRSLKFRFVVI